MFLYSYVMRLLMGFKEYHSEGMIPLKDSHEWTQALDGNTNDSIGDGEAIATSAAEITDEHFPCYILEEAIREVRQDHEDKVKEILKIWEIQSEFYDDGAKVIAVWIPSTATRYTWLTRRTSYGLPQERDVSGMMHGTANSPRFD